MTQQHVPTKPTGCYLDYTYCGSKNCENKCGRKMSDEIKKAIEKIPYSRVAFADFCNDDIIHPDDIGVDSDT